VRRWDPATPLTEGRFGHQVGVAVNAAGNQIIYAFGGMELVTFEQTTTSVVEAYDALADSWTPRSPSPMPDSRVNGVGRIGGKF
jgi:predicted lipoprotein with Yx(FWY)xxD motif